MTTNEAIHYVKEMIEDDKEVGWVQEEAIETILAKLEKVREVVELVPNVKEYESNDFCNECVDEYEVMKLANNFNKLVTLLKEVVE